MKKRAPRRPRAVLYARVSPRPDRQSQSCDFQLDKLYRYCDLKDYEVVSVHRDEYASGSRADNRPGLQAALADARRYRAAIAVYSISRLSRDHVDAWAIVKALRKRKAELISIQENIDTETAMGRFGLAVIIAALVLERELLGERTSQAMQRLQANGHRMSSRPPYGKMTHPADPLTLIDQPDEQITLQMIRQLRASGSGARLIARALDQAGRAPRSGGKWCVASVSKILRRHDPEWKGEEE